MQVDGASDVACVTVALMKLARLQSLSLMVVLVLAMLMTSVGMLVLGGLGVRVPMTTGTGFLGGR